jgi:hypothetical protein
VFFTRDVEPNFDWHPILESVCVLSRNMWDNNRQYYSIIRENPIALRVKLADIADNADEARLALLDPETAERLRRKYAKARRALGGE